MIVSYKMDSSNPKMPLLSSTNFVNLFKEKVQWAYLLDATRFAFFEPSPLGKSEKRVKMRRLSTDGLTGTSFLPHQKKETLALEDSLDSGISYSKLAA